MENRVHIANVAGVWQLIYIQGYKHEASSDKGKLNKPYSQQRTWSIFLAFNYFTTMWLVFTGCTIPKQKVVWWWMMHWDSCGRNGHNKFRYHLNELTKTIKNLSGWLMISHYVSPPSLSALSDECTLPMSFKSCH